MAKHRSTATKRGKRGMGRLYKRVGGREYPADSNVAGSYWLSYTLHGARRRVGLYDDRGRPITKRAEAEAARLRILGEHIAADKAESVKTLLRQLGEAETEAAAAREAAKPILRLADTWPAFVAHPGRPDSSPATLRQYSFQWDRFEDWLRANRRQAKSIADVDPETAREYAKHLGAAGLTANTYNKHLALLALVWRVLGDEAGVSVNPWQNPKRSPAGRGIARKQLASEGRRELTIDELRRVCGGLEGEMRLLFALGVYCGLRLGDAAQLDWGEVDLRRNVILRVPAKTARRRQTPVRIPLHPVLAAMLSETPESRRNGPVLPDCCETYRRRRDALTDRIQRHFESCGIATYAPGTGPGTDRRAVLRVGYHSMRHTFVSLAREAGAPLAVVEGLVGHGSPAMTRHYTHTSEAAAGAAIALLPTVTETGADSAGPAAREPLPTWAAELAEGLTGRNWRKVRAELLAGAGR